MPVRTQARHASRWRGSRYLRRPEAHHYWLVLHAQSYACACHASPAWKQHVHCVCVCESPFLNKLTIRPSLHCLGTVSSCQITENSCSNKYTIPEPPYLSNSPTNPSLPPVLLFSNALYYLSLFYFVILHTTLTCCRIYSHYSQPLPSTRHQNYYPN